jgi:hypothetical protein
MASWQSNHGRDVPAGASTPEAGGAAGLQSPHRRAWEAPKVVRMDAGSAELNLGPLEDLSDLRS